MAIQKNGCSDCTTAADLDRLSASAAIEAVLLGNGGLRHQKTLQALIAAGADLMLTDRQGNTPLQLAKSRGFGAMVKLLEEAGAK